jgi:hypothetical protein
MIKPLIYLAWLSIITVAVCSQASDIPSARRSELESILRVLHWKPDRSDPDKSSGENPGWYNPTNRESLRRFIAKYPDSEDAYMGQVWLTFAEAATDRSWSISETKRRNADRATHLKQIIATTMRTGTAKAARVIRACLLLDAEDHAGLSEQAREILTNIKDYESEKDEQFLRFSKVTETPPSEIEPYLRRMLIISECHQHHLEKALAMAQDLKMKFPEWSSREGTDGNIELLKSGKSPYPTWEELRNLGRIK